MSLTVVVKEPVYAFVRRLPPEHRRAAKRALADLGRGKGDIRALEQTLAGYYRLRIGKYRLIFRYTEASTVEAIFIEERSIVYEVFEAQFLARLKSQGIE